MDVREFPPRPNVEQYKKQSKELLAAAKSGETTAVRRLARAQRVPGKPRPNVNDIRLTLANAQLAVAREHGFESWPKFVRHIDGLRHGAIHDFERAADAVVSGDLATLRDLVQNNPDITRARSSREHHATLLHYVAANGVEDFRQKSPRNAPEVAKLLLDNGAEVDATSASYAGHWDTPLNLLVSSVHPAKANVQVALVDVLADYGAAINGVRDDGSPLLTAIAFRYPQAAEALARRGARVDNIVMAAGLGRVDLIAEFLDRNGHLKPNSPLVNVVWRRIPDTPEANVHLALVWAAMNNRAPVVELMLQRGVDPGARDHRNWTGLHWAAFYRYSDIVELFLKHNAPLEARNEFNGTVLGQTVWMAERDKDPAGYVEVLRRLLIAGARVEEVGYPTGIAVIDRLLEQFDVTSV